MYGNMVSFSLEGIPQTVANATGGVSVDVAGILVSMLFILLCCVPFIMARFNVLVFPMAIMGFFFSVGVGWLAGWLVMIVVMAIAGIFAFGFIKTVWS